MAAAQLVSEGTLCLTVGAYLTLYTRLIPGLAIIQAVLISFPLYDACRAEAKDNAARLHNAPYGVGSSIEDMINIIDHHSEPLIDYAASTRFNAELIIFLRDVKKWRTTWTSPDLDWVAPNTPEERAAALARILSAPGRGWSSEGRTMTRDEMHER